MVFVQHLKIVCSLILLKYKWKGKETWIVICMRLTDDTTNWRIIIICFSIDIWNQNSKLNDYLIRTYVSHWLHLDILLIVFVFYDDDTLMCMLHCAFANDLNVRKKIRTRINACVRSHYYIEINDSIIEYKIENQNVKWIISIVLHASFWRGNTNTLEFPSVNSNYYFHYISMNSPFVTAANRYNQQVDSSNYNLSTIQRLNAVSIKRFHFKQEAAIVQLKLCCNLLIRMCNIWLPFFIWILIYWDNHLHLSKINKIIIISKWRIQNAMHTSTMTYLIEHVST